MRRGGRSCSVLYYELSASFEKDCPVRAGRRDNKGIRGRHDGMKGCVPALSDDDQWKKRDSARLEDQAPGSAVS